MSVTVFRPAWLDWPDIRRIIDAYAEHNADIQFVGGALRDSLLRIAPKDIDIVTAQAPERSLAMLHKAGIPASIKYARYQTIGIRTPQLQCEINYLRDYTGVPLAEAMRQYVLRTDLTINALYLLLPDQLHDYTGGIADAQHGIVRFFAGDKEAYVREDPVRILRFFRFHALFGKGKPDAASLKACIANEALLANMHPIRLQVESCKLLCAVAPHATLMVMQQHGFVERLFGPDFHVGHGMQMLETLEASLPRRPDPAVRLSLLLLENGYTDKTGLAHLARFWQLEGGLYAELDMLLGAYAHMQSPSASMRDAVQKLGKGRAKNLLLLHWALGGIMPESGQLHAAMDAIDRA